MAIDYNSMAIDYNSMNKIFKTRNSTIFVSYLLKFLKVDIFTSKLGSGTFVVFLELCFTLQYSTHCTDNNSNRRNIQAQQLGLCKLEWQL